MSAHVSHEKISSGVIIALNYGSLLFKFAKIQYSSIHVCRL